MESSARAERGVALPLVALLMTVLLFVCAIVIDLGNGWRVRRALIPASDAAALAAAQDVADPSVNAAAPCGTTAPGYVTLNEPTATMTGCEVVAYNSEQGRVTVTASETVTPFFASVLGLGDFTVSSTSSAVYGPPAAASGLRPLGICYFGSPELQNILANPPTSPVDLTIVYGSNQPDACGESPGNWGTLRFNWTNSGNPPFESWLLSGYPDLVNFSNHTVTTCDGDPHCYYGNTGAIANNLRDELDALIASGEYFLTPVFNFVQDPGNNSRFHLMGAIRVQLTGYVLTGPQADRRLSFRVMPGLVTGECCGPAGGTGGNKVIAICGVDPGVYAACEP